MGKTVGFMAFRTNRHKVSYLFFYQKGNNAATRCYQRRSGNYDEKAENADTGLVGTDTEPASDYGAPRP